MVLLEREPEMAIVDQAAAIPHLAVLFWPKEAEQEVEDQLQRALLLVAEAEVGLVRGHLRELGVALDCL